MATIFELALKNYNRGLWTDDMLNTLLNKGKITLDEYKEIANALPVSADLEALNLFT